jgi:hypothetical protein
MANVVLPKVRMFIPCLAVDLGPGKPVTIRSPLHTIRMAPGVTAKYILDEMWFYIVLTDGVGTFRLSVELHGMDDIVLSKTEPEKVTFVGGSQLNVRELRIPMESVPLVRPGLYEFRLLANHAHVEEGGTALLRVLPG